MQKSFSVLGVSMLALKKAMPTQAFSTGPNAFVPMKNPMELNKMNQCVTMIVPEMLLQNVAATGK